MSDEFDLHAYANIAEAMLWLGFAAICAFKGRKSEGKAQRAFVWLALGFAAFGLSDLVEARTGAWWEPIWLLGWKVACVLVLARQSFKVLKMRQSAEAR